MDRRAVIRTVMQGKRSERIPRAIFGGGRWALRQAGLRIEDLKDDPVAFGDKLVDVYATLDTDMVFAGSGLNSFPAEAIGGVLAFDEKQAPLLSFPIIENLSDAQGLTDIDIEHSPYTTALISMISRMRERLPDRFIGVTSWGPFAWAMILCDWNRLQDKIVTDKSFVREICELGIRLSSALIIPLAEQGLIDGISIPDGATTLVPNDIYNDVILPAEKKLFAFAKEEGLLTILHQCGQIKRQLELYPETGADCISIDNSVQLRDAQELWGNDVVLAGNVDVVNTVMGGDPNKLCDAVMESLDGLPDPFRNYIMMPSCDLPPDTPLENVEKFLACADMIVIK
jgi:uroporphyrinogen decarboxylase